MLDIVNQILRDEASVYVRINFLSRAYLYLVNTRRTLVSEDFRHDPIQRLRSQARSRADLKLGTYPNLVTSDENLMRVVSSHNSNIRSKKMLASCSEQDIYQSIADKITFKPEVLAHSPQNDVIKKLEQWSKDMQKKLTPQKRGARSVKKSTKKQNKLTPETLVAQLLERAKVEQYKRSYLQYGVIQFFRHFKGNDSKTLFQALYYMYETETSADAIHVKLDLMEESSHACHSRHNNTFYSILQYVRTLMKIHSVEEMTPKTELVEAVYEFLDEVKRSAFETAFIQPAEIVFRLNHDTVMMDDVNIHGLNVYLLILEKVLGIKFPITPLEHDQMTGIVAFLDKSVIDEMALEEVETYLSDTKNFGKAWRMKDHYRHKFCKLPGNAKNIFIVPGQSPIQVALNAQSLRPKELKPYLENFVQFLEPSFLFPLLLNHLNEAELITSVLQPLYEEMKKKGMVSVEEDEEAEGNVQAWIWGKDYNPVPCFTQLLDYIGLIRNMPYSLPKPENDLHQSLPLSNFSTF